MDGMGRQRLRLYLAYTDAEFANAYSPAAFARLERSVDVVRNTTGEVLRGEALAHAARGCDLMIGYRSTPCDAEALRGMPHLIAFLRAAVDLGTVDVDEASRQGILVTRVSPGFHNAVAELGIGLMIDVARGITRHRLQLGGGQHLPPQQGTELAGSTLGFAGYGGIARHMNALARAMGMRTIACDPFVREADLPLVALDELLAQADFVVCLAAATPSTRHLFDAQAFGRMKRGAFFVNLSRGELVDEDALERALDAGHLGGAALDVGSAPDQKPAARFIGRTDVVVTQHIGATTTQARARQTMDTIVQVESIAAGLMPSGAVNPDAAYRFTRRFALSSMETHT